MKPVDVKASTYVDFNVEKMIKILILSLVEYVRISKNKNIFAKGYVPNWSEKVFMIKKVKNTVQWTNVIRDVNGEEIFGTLYQ